MLVERSIPLGPSFSFPSIPSLPGTGFFSFFSWKSSSSQGQQQQQQQQEEDTDKASAESSSNGANDIVNEQVGEDNVNASAQAGKQTDRGMAKQRKKSKRDDSDNKLISSFNAFLQYFSSSGRKYQSSTNDNDGARQSDEQEQPPGIITWDPIRDEARCHFLNVGTNEGDIVSTRITRGLDIMTAMENASEGVPRKRPILRSRSRTVGSPNELITLSNPDIKSDVVKSNQSDPESKMKKRHLVEVLGIDGVRMESFERVEDTFNTAATDHNKDYHRSDKQEQMQSSKENLQAENDKDSVSQQQCDESDKDNKQVQGDKNNNTSVSISSVSKDNGSDNEQHSQKEDGKQNVWSDLNKEIHEPGPGITEPGQSKTDVAEDASKGKDSETTKDEEAAAAKEAAMQQTKLPGGRRIDHVLQPESFMSMIANEYIVGLRAHFSYWTNKDLLWHVMCRLEDLKENMTEPLIQ